MAGRKPKPTALKELTGNPGHRPLNKKEPKFSGKPEMPSIVAKTPEAKLEWERVTRDLAALDLLKATDQAMLAGYCMQWARYVQAEEEISREGQTTRVLKTNKAGELIFVDGQTVVEIKRHPAVLNAKDALALMKNIAASFGFDPSSRSRINLNPNEETEDPFERFLNGDNSTKEEEPDDSGTVH